MRFVILTDDEVKKIWLIYLSIVKGILEKLLRTQENFSIVHKLINVLTNF